MDKEYKYMVATECMTYNHAPYIEDSLRGFAMQETAFPVVYIVVDDASTDGEPDVIKQYLFDNFQDPFRTEETEDYCLICANHSSNANCTFVVVFLKYNHYSIKKTKLPYIKEWKNSAKYIAICEGDDYWIDSSKLRKQVDFLENNADYGLVYTYRKRLYQATGLIVEEANHEYYGNVTSKLIIDNFIPTLTICYRNSLIKELDMSYSKIPLLMQDYPFVIELSRHSKIHCLTDVTAIYRVLNESASHSTSLNKRLEFKKNTYQIKLFFIKKYGFDELYTEIYSKYLYIESLICILEKRYLDAIKNYCKSGQYSVKDFGRIIYYCFRRG